MNNIPPDSGFSLESLWGKPYASAQGADDYSSMADALRKFLDQVAGAKPDPQTLGRLSQTLQSWTDELSPHAVPERQQPFGRMTQVAGRAQPMIPLFVATEGDQNSVRGTVVFGRYFLGGNGAAHGGAVALLFDEVMGRLQFAALRPRARTAYLHVDYRAITPIDKLLDVSARIVSEEGRKIRITAEIRDGATVVAQAEGLWVALRPGQP
ncbi:MAG: thioesterase family protein [Polaromonas sp.]|nr:thioesterase family protein [Polaromonas sp.]